MKKLMMMVLVGGLLLGSSSGVLANNVPLPVLEDNDTIQTMGIAGGSVETNEIIRVYPDSFPEGYNCKCQTVGTYS